MVRMVVIYVGNLIYFVVNSPFFSNQIPNLAAALSAVPKRSQLIKLHKNNHQLFQTINDDFNGHGN